MQVCPKCKRKFDRLLALSRLDNKTMICDACGMKEAMDDFFRYAKATMDLKKSERVTRCDRSKNI